MNFLAVLELVLGAAPELIKDVEDLVAGVKAKNAATTPEASLAAKIASDTAALAAKLAGK